MNDTIVTDDASRHFDAPRRGSAVRASAAAPLRWGTVVALTVIASILTTMAFCLVAVDMIGSDRVDASIASVSIFVAADTDASPAEIDALGPLVRAVPGVSDATLRSKDDAIKSLLARGLPPPDGRNPLPDVWIVRLRAGVAGDEKSVATAWTEKRQVLASLPRVASVSTDERWVATIDRGVTEWRRRWPAARSVGLGILALAAACAGYLAGPGTSTAGAIGMRALALVAFLAGVIGTGVGYATTWILVDRFGGAFASGVGSSFGQLVSGRPLFSASIVAAMILILAVGLFIGGRPHE